MIGALSTVHIGGRLKAIVARADNLVASGHMVRSVMAYAMATMGTRAMALTAPIKRLDAVGSHLSEV